MATSKAPSRSNGSKDFTADAAKAASSDFDALKADIAQLREDMASLASNSGKYMKGRSSAEFEKSVERGKEHAEKASAKAGKSRDYIEDKVRENPLASLGIAFGTGVLIAALRRK